MRSKKKIEWNEQIPSEALVDYDIPGNNAAMGDIVKFASTFNGYTYTGNLQACAALHRKVMSGYKTDKDHLKKQSSDELRSSLFFLYRAWNHQGNGDNSHEMRILIEEIKRRYEPSF